MERIQHLINQLTKQQAKGESISELLNTVQMLQQQLILKQKSRAAENFKAAVVMPGNTALHPEGKWEETEAVPGLSIPESDRRFMPADNLRAPNPLVATAQNLPPEPVRSEPLPVKQKVEALPIQTVTPPQVFPAYDDEEIPTLSPQRAKEKELHEVLAETKGSLNDSLKAERKELGNAFKEAPIKDLRKGIGVNDKFVFISELFRGDDIMYERSIKTINEFRILPEAEYWINRELKVKLGWNDAKDTVQHFYAIVRRRFS